MFVTSKIIAVDQYFENDLKFSLDVKHLFRANKFMNVCPSIFICFVFIRFFLKQSRNA